MSLKRFPTLLLSTDLIVSISFTEYSSNVRFALEIELKLIIENVTFAAFCGELNDITKSLSVMFQSEGYDILNPSIGFSTVKNGFASDDVGVIALDIDILKLTNKDNNKNDIRTTVNSRCLIRWDVFCLRVRDYNNIYRVSIR